MSRDWSSKFKMEEATYALAEQSSPGCMGFALVIGCMCMYACMYVYIYVCLWVCMYVCMYL